MDFSCSVHKYAVTSSLVLVYGGAARPDIVSIYAPACFIGGSGFLLLDEWNSFLILLLPVVEVDLGCKCSVHNPSNYRTLSIQSTFQSVTSLS